MKLPKNIHIETTMREYWLACHVRHATWAREWAVTGNTNYARDSANNAREYYQLYVTT